MNVKLCTRCPYTARDLSGHYDPKAVIHLCAKCDGERPASIKHYPHKTRRRQECATVFNIEVTAQPTAAQSVREGLVSSDTTPGGPPSVQKNAPSVSKTVERTTADFYLVSRSPNDGCDDDPGAISRSSISWTKEIAQ
jgi:hypothetical protein